MGWDMRNKLRRSVIATLLIAVPLSAYAMQPAATYCSEYEIGIFYPLYGLADFLTYLISGAVNVCAP